MWAFSWCRWWHAIRIDCHLIYSSMIVFWSYLEISCGADDRVGLIIVLAMVRASREPPALIKEDWGELESLFSPMPPQTSSSLPSASWCPWGPFDLGVRLSNALCEPCPVLSLYCIGIKSLARSQRDISGLGQSYLWIYRSLQCR